MLNKENTSEQPITVDASAIRQAEAHRYTRRSILRSEAMYGNGFQSPGGLAAVESFCARLKLAPGMRALDIGSGLGGAAFHLAGRHGLHVLGLDVSEAMVAISTERLAENGLPNVSFRRADVRTAELEPASFELVWTRDCVLYIADKDLVWRQVASCLAPGGQLFVTDFARGAGALSADFRSYIEACDYHLDTLASYAERLEAAGLRVEAAEDITDDFIHGLVQEQGHLRARRAAFLEAFEPADYDYLMQRWDQKIRFCRDGDMKWGLFIARKG